MNKTFSIGITVLVVILTAILYATQPSETSAHPQAYIDLGFKFPWPSDKNPLYFNSGPHDSWYSRKACDPVSPATANGLDFGDIGVEGLPVLAVADGRIKDTTKWDGSTNTSWGNSIVIEHTNGYLVRYAHLKDDPSTFPFLNPIPGTYVFQGQWIGNVGHSGTGGEENAHLHLDLMTNNGVNNQETWNGKIIDGWTVHTVEDPNHPGQVYNYLGTMTKGPEMSQMLTNTICGSVGAVTAEQYRVSNYGPKLKGNGYNDLNSTNKMLLYCTMDPLSLIPLRFTGNAVAISCVPNINPTNNAAFISDITLPDGSTLSPGQSTTKTWRIKNTGTSTWGSGYTWVYVSGDQLGAPGSVAVPTTSPSNTADISVNVTAPTTPGTYTGYWRMKNPQGVFFGDTVRVTISVPGTPSSTATINVISTNYPSVVTPGQQFQPQITVQPIGIQLLQSRGDMLRNTDGNLYGAYQHVAVVGTVNSGQNYTFTFYPANPITAPSSEGTYQSKWRVWANGAFVGPEITIQFTVKNGGGTKPNAPSPTSPGDWYVSQDGSTPQLCASVSGLVQYYFEIFESQSIPNSGWISNNCWTPPTLSPGGYQWHVKVRDNSSGLQSDWSTTRHFTIISQDLVTHGPFFDPGSPSNAERVRSWFCIENSGGVEIYANTAPDNSTSGTWQWVDHPVPGLCNSDENDHSKWPQWDTLIQPDGTHRIRARAWRGTPGQPGYSEKIIETSYTLQHRRPASVQTINPVSEDWLDTRTVTFRWLPREPTRVDYLRLYVSTNANPQISPIVNQVLASSAREYTVTFNSDYSSLYWGVDACNDLGCIGLETSHFGIDRTLPSSAVGVLNPTSYETAFTVQWSGTDNASGIRWYDVQYRDGDQGAWVDWQTNVSQTAAIFHGQPGHKYYFRARALDKAGNQEDYPAGNGDTFTTVNPAAAPQAPWWNSAYGFKRNLLVLNNDAGSLGVGYPIRLRFDATTTPTAAQLYTASQSATKGNDFRIVYNNTTELNRFVRRFDSSEIDIWFSLQQAIGGTPASDATSYQLYYGNPAAGSPPADTNAVFYPGTDGNVVGLWHFFNGSGATVTDTSGRNHNGTATGNYSWKLDGKFGPAMWFDGSSVNVNAGNSSDFNLNNFTLEAWVYRPLDSKSDEYTVIAKAKSDGAAAYGLFVSGNTVGMRTDGGDYISSPANVPLGRWTHIAATFDGSTGRVYMDGNLWKSGGTRVPPVTSAPLLIGQTYLGETPKKFYGYIQGVRVSNIARTSFPYASFGQILNEPSSAAGDVITKPQTGTADLNVQSLIALPPDANNQVLVQAIVSNQGNAPTVNGFYIDLYSNHQPTGVGDFSNIGRFWVASPIEAGTSITLTTILTDTGTLLTRQARLPATTEISGTLYVQADSYGVVNETSKSNNISGGMQICSASADAFESDGNAASAKSLSIGVAQNHNLHMVGDQDWLKFTAQAGKAYTIQTSNLSSNADTYLYFYGTDGTTLLASNDDYGGTLASRIDWTAPTAGTFYVMVKHWNPNVGGCGTSYSVTVSQSVTNNNSQYLPFIRK
jgi:murein DD-endopeptidase MepM/ murein hydrolase activator NlpD